jgi:DNA mismatch repair protein MSH6
MQRYWEIKRNNFDMIIFFRFSIYYVLFYQDAVESSKILDLCIVPDSKMVGFFKGQLLENTEKLIDKGYKVAIAELDETLNYKKNRIKEPSDENIKTIRRKVVSVCSIGTFLKEGNNSSILDYDTKYILAFFQDDYKFGFCYFEFSTLKFYLGSFEDDFTLKQFRTLIIKIRPVEAICSYSALKNHHNKRVKKYYPAFKLLRNSHTPPSFTFISMKTIDTEQKIREKLGHYFGEDFSNWPNTIKRVF